MWDEDDEEPLFDNDPNYRPDGYSWLDPNDLDDMQDVEEDDYSENSFP